MTEILRGTDLCGWSVVGVVLITVATEAARRAPALCQKAAGWSALLTILLVGGLGAAEARPQDTAEVLTLLVVTWNAACAAAIAAMVVVPVGQFLYRGWAGAIRSRREAVARRRAQRAAAIEAKRRAALPPPPPPPPPTKAERLERLRSALDEEVRLIDALPLPDEEKAIVRANAERKFLERIEGLLG